MKTRKTSAIETEKKLGMEEKQQKNEYKQHCNCKVIFSQENSTMKNDDIMDRDNDDYCYILLAMAKSWKRENYKRTRDRNPETQTNEMKVEKDFFRL